MKKILVVDDDPVIQKLLYQMLTRHGYDVMIAQDGVEAMDAVQRFLPDLMVLDIMMPHMNGYDVCRAMKINIYLKHIHIILLSSLDQSIQSRFLSSLGIEYLNKNCQPQEIIEKIEQMLGEKSDLH
jgi:twitching motility two-component system response regulator PilH